MIYIVVASIATIIGTCIILFIIFLINRENYSIENNYINPKFVSGVVTEIICPINERCQISFEYTVNNIKYTNTSEQNNLTANYKKNQEIIVIYSSNNSEYSSIYEKSYTIYYWILIITALILLTLLWIFFIYTINII
jgi:hypothetical protein